MRTLRSLREMVTLACLIGIAAPTFARTQRSTTAAAPAQEVRFAAAIQAFLDNDKTARGTAQKDG
jgi:hypothetical protein